MKKLIYFLMVVGLMITSGCDPMDDINAIIDAQDNPVVGDAVYNLTDEDYDALDLGYGSFSSIDDAKTDLPNFLKNKYPAWGKGSSVLVGYKLYIGNAPGVSDYTYADQYRLSNADYPQGSLNAVAFYPNENPEDFLGNVLTTNVADPVDGQFTLAKFKQYVEIPVEGISNHLEADFKTVGTLLDFTPFSVAGDDQVWVGTNYGAKMSGYSGGAQPNEDWLVSSEIDLTGQVNPTFQVTQVLNYDDSGSDFYNIMVTEDFTGDVTTTTWDVIDVDPVPAGSSWSAVTSDDFSLSAYEGKKIVLAFKYESTADLAGTWEIEKALIKVPGVEGATKNTEMFYTFSGGEWVKSEGVYFLSDADFDSMGEASGQPGRYNNFSSSISPNDYLPTFLTLKFPYGQEGEELFVIYDYYSSSSGAQLRGNLYTVIDGMWVGHESTINTTLQFANDGSTWVPDNTIKYEFAAADYDYIVDTFTGVSGYESVIANLSNYGNFNMFSWTEDQIDAAINAVLMNNFSGMAEGQKFAVTIYVYDGSSHNLTINYVLSGGVYVRN